MPDQIKKLCVPKNRSFFIGTVECKVHSITGAQQFKITTVNAPGAVGDTIHSINPVADIELVPGIYAKAGKAVTGDDTGQKVNITITAKTGVTIRMDRVHNRT